MSDFAKAQGTSNAHQLVQGKPLKRSNVQTNQENEYASIAAPNKRPSSQTRIIPHQDPIGSPPKPFPSTPATRLPLADLLGHNDDAAHRRFVPSDESPEDHIAWKASNSPTKSSQKTPANKSRKRARSSSPPSSTRRPPKRIDRSGDEPLDLRNLKSSLQTPTADPAAELWKRYAAGTPSGLAGLLASSSPRVGDDKASNISGLRRWTSCGVEWPSSKAKRRKLAAETIHESLDEDFEDQPNRLSTKKTHSTSNPTNSRIGNLLSRMQESLSRPVEQPSADTGGPSSSSPLPAREEIYDRASISPCRAPELANRVNTNENSPSPKERLAGQNVQGTKPCSSSFGSDTLDDQLLDQVAEAQAASKGTPRTISGDTWKAADSDARQMTSLRQSEKHDAPQDMAIEDEFGDSDLDVDDFEKIASMQTPTAIKQTSHNVNIPSNNSVTEEKSDEFDDDDLDEASLAFAEATATQAVHIQPISQNKAGSSPKSGATIQRYLVVNVAESTYKNKRGMVQCEKILSVEEESTKLYKLITLRESWYETRCTKGSFVHVIGSFDRHGLCTIDDAHNMLILHPDHLISALVVADSFGCTRRAVLQDRIKATSDPSPPMVYGTMLHEIFQEAITVNRWEDDWLRQTIEKIATRHLEDLYAVKLTVKDVIDHLMTKVPHLQAWARLFIMATPSVKSVVKGRNDEKLLMSVNKLLDVEEHVWSPMYGLKGNIDATVQVVMKDEHGERTLTVPFEVKTGKNTSNASHRAQTALYTLLLSDRYDVAVAYGILYYLETSETTRIPAIRHELQHMIMQRNELASYVRERLSLPPMIKNTHVCNRCYARTACLLYHKLVEDGDGDTSGLRDKFDAACGHLKPQHQEFFKKWDDLLTKEESEVMKFRRELWTMASVDREKLGRCFANVILEAGSAYEERGTSKINRFQYTFRKRDDEAAGFSFNDSQLTIGEPIVISDEKGHYALANGFVTAIQKHHVSVAVDRRLHNARTKMDGFEAEVNQTFAGIMEVGKSGETSQRIPGAEDLLFRLDKDEFSNGMATVRNNVLEIMSDEAFHARALRELIVDDKEPRFKCSSSAYELQGPQSQMNLNADQTAAIDKILRAQDYALVLGMPGTGKTTTIAHIIRALVAKGKSVLLTSYTHTAVDNILLKIRSPDVRVLRLGAVAKVHPDVREFAILGGEPKASIEEIQDAYHGPQVVATTCLGINHQVFRERLFDYCIVDEASQITLPVCLGPIRMAKAFVLVGDHYQLPPLVQNKEALEGGLDVSLFKLLCERHPTAVVALAHQYRMNAEVMSLSNRLIYSGRLVCGSPAVADRRLQLPSLDRLSRLHSAGASCPSSSSPDCLLQRALAPDSPSVAFLDTDACDAREVHAGSRITNPAEASVVTQLVRGLLSAGASPSAIGVVTLYRSQLALIKQQLHGSKVLGEFAGQGGGDLVEAHTADRFQGRDKEIILLSCVRANDAAAVGDLLRDWRRVNVAVTRARSKLVIVGSARTLRQGDEVLRGLVDMCEEKHWLVKLVPEMLDLDAHNWGRGHSQREVKVEEPEVQKVVEEAPARQLSDKGRPPLGVRNVNAAEFRQKPFKPPRRVGKVTAKALLGSENIKDRPVLADIVREIVGEDGLS